MEFEMVRRHHNAETLAGYKSRLARITRHPDQARGKREREYLELQLGLRKPQKPAAGSIRSDIRDVRGDKRRPRIEGGKKIYDRPAASAQGKPSGGLRRAMLETCMTKGLLPQKSEPGAEQSRTNPRRSDEPRRKGRLVENMKAIIKQRGMVLRETREG